jgi:hypothetical protein
MCVAFCLLRPITWVKSLRPNDTNPIDPARAAKAGLDYLALGDRHRTLQVGPAIWYAETPPLTP